MQSLRDSHGTFGMRAGWRQSAAIGPCYDCLGQTKPHKWVASFLLQLPQLRHCDRLQASRNCCCVKYVLVGTTHVGVPGAGPAHDLVTTQLLGAAEAHAHAIGGTASAGGLGHHPCSGNGQKSNMHWWVAPRRRLSNWEVLDAGEPQEPSNTLVDQR